MRWTGCLLPLGALVAMLASSIVVAASPRTFVASTGADTNACSLGAPCRSFAAAIAKTSSGGEIVVLDSAGYGPVTITQSISLIAPPGVHAGITVASGDGITVDAAGGTVVLRGLSINGQGGGQGVNVVNVARLRMESCIVSSMTLNGVFVHAAGSESVILDTIVRDNGGSGIAVAADASVVVERIRSEHNTFDGFYIVPAANAATATIIDSTFAHNGADGISIDTLDGSSTYAQIERSTMAGNAARGFIGSAQPGAAISAVLVRNAVNRNGSDGIRASGTINVRLSENAINANGSAGIIATGTGTGTVVVSANTSSGNAFVDLACNGNDVQSLGNNSFGAVSAVGCSITIVSGG